MYNTIFDCMMLFSDIDRYITDHPQVIKLDQIKL